MEKLYFLNFVINGHPLFKKNTSISTFAKSKVFMDDEGVTNLFNNLYFNNVIALTGKNATGKTTLLKLIIGTLNLLTNPDTQIIKSTCLTEVLRKNNPVNMEIYFYGTDKKIIKDEISFDIDSETNEWIISSEKIYEKKISKSTRKKHIFDFDKEKLPVFDREEISDQLGNKFPHNISIFNVFYRSKYKIQRVYEKLFTTNINAVLVKEETVSPELLNYLDPSIEYLKVCSQETESGNTAYYKLKFKNSSREITEYNFATLMRYLSSGTQKAITLYDMVLNALKKGGILFVDEIENHFNTEIVKDFINFFKDSSINVHGAVLIFSTHYSEMLDDIERNDNIYITNRTDKVELFRYSDLNIRSDFSKTEVYKASSIKVPNSSDIVKTSPSYDAYIGLKRATKSLVRDEKKNG